jgi:undecaprenyl-diphosphatase
MSVTVFFVKDVIYIAALIAVVVLAWAAYQKKAWLRVAADAVAAGAVALALAKLAGKLYYDPRPFVHGACRAVVPHAADNGFPSDHTLLGAAMAAIVWRYSKLWSVIIGLLTIAVGSARVVGCIHSPIDIIGAFAIGIVGALAGRWVVDKLWPKNAEIKESA